MDRRTLLRSTLAAGLAGGVWSPANAGRIQCEGDGTPLQFMPRTLPDDEPLVDELKKYPRLERAGLGSNLSELKLFQSIIQCVAADAQQARGMGLVIA